MLQSDKIDVLQLFSILLDFLSLTIIDEECKAIVLILIHAYTNNNTIREYITYIYLYI